MMQISTVWIDSGALPAIDKAINEELQRLGKKAFAIQYHHYFTPSGRKDGKTTLRIVAHIQYEEPDTI